jgi:hypothetical protein
MVRNTPCFPKVYRPRAALRTKGHDIFSGLRRFCNSNDMVMMTMALHRHLTLSGGRRRRQPEAASDAPGAGARDLAEVQ